MLLMPCKLTRIEGGSAMRTDVIEGAGTPPKVGRPFTMFAKPLDNPDATTRAVNTSPLVSVTEKDDYFVLRTMSGSVYKLEFPDDP